MKIEVKITSNCFCTHTQLCQNSKFRCWSFVWVSLTIWSSCGSSWACRDQNFTMRRLGKVCRAVSREIRYREMDRRTWRAAGRGQARLAYMNGQKMMIWYNINSSLWHFKNLYCFFFTTRASYISPPPQASYVLAQLYIFVCTNTHNTAVFGKTKTKTKQIPPKKQKNNLNGFVWCYFIP